MKAYEKRIVLEKKLTHAQYNFKKLNSKVENQKNNIAILKQRHTMIETEEVELLRHLEDDKAIFFDVMKDCKKQLKTFKNKGKAIPKPKPEPEPIPEPEKIVISEDPIIHKSPNTEEAKVNFTVEQVQQVKQELNGVIKELHPENVGKDECPICHNFYTRGGAFAAHYKSHNNGNGD